MSVPENALRPTRQSRSKEDDALLRQQQKDRRRREKELRKARRPSGVKGADHPGAPDRLCMRVRVMGEQAGTTEIDQR